jgi:hypothetical protein
MQVAALPKGCLNNKFKFKLNKLKGKEEKNEQTKNLTIEQKIKHNRAKNGQFSPVIEITG